MTDTVVHPTGATLFRVIAPTVRNSNGRWQTIARDVFEYGSRTRDFSAASAIMVRDTPMEPIADAVATIHDAAQPETMGEAVELMKISGLICPCCGKFISEEISTPWLIDFLTSELNGPAMDGDQIAYKLESLAAAMQPLH